MNKKSHVVTPGPVQPALQAIELLDSAIHYPGDHLSLNKFQFNIGITSKADDEKKLLFVIVKIDVHNENMHQLLGGITISCVFTLSNFDAVVRMNAAGQPDMPDYLVELLHSTALSTARGVMFATFRGTFLHNALLPLVTPGSLIEDQKK